MITMRTTWLLLVVVVACTQRVDSQSTTDYQTCTDKDPTCRLEILFEKQQRDIARLFDNQNQLVQQLQLVLNALGLTAKPSNASAPRDCYDIHISGNRSDGVYTVYVGSEQRPVKVYCDMTTDGGGWTVFQRRKDGSVDFYRKWNDYRTGFGNPHGEFWLGNDNLHLMTTDRRQRLRVDLADWDGHTTYAEYDNFIVGSAQYRYALYSLGVYRGYAGDSLTDWHLGNKFRTKDQDNYVSCARERKGGWWYTFKDCYHSNLNGHYYTEGSESDDSVTWKTWKGFRYSLKFTEMKIRPFYI